VRRAPKLKAKTKAKPKPKKAPFRFLFVTDPWPTLDHPKDTTLRLAEEAIAQGAEAHWCDARTIRWDQDCVLLDARQILQVYPGRVDKAFKLADAVPAPPADFDSIHYRTDPPVDLHYLHPLQLLAMGTEGSGVELVNPAEVLFLGNEKLEASALGDLMPPTLVASEWAKLHAFGLSEGRTVLKPLHQAQSKGIELLDWATEAGANRARAALKEATEDFARPVVLQRYLAGISQGEQRLWFVDGKLLASVRKLPLPKDFRVDLDRGSRIVRTELDPAERKAGQRIARHLKERRIRLAAVDLIDGFVTDFNFTSPGLIPQMEGVLGLNLAKPIVQALMRRKPAHRSMRQ
jgi:glutathione synthase